MTKAIFFFIAAVLLLLPVVVQVGEMPIEYQLMLCTPFLLLLGIPHGAIDNILYVRDKQLTTKRFVAGYLVFVGLNVLLWLLFPVMAYASFLLLSAYHFGQSQFSHYFSKQPLGHKALYILWGIAILSGLVYLNIEEMQQIMGQDAAFGALGPLHHERLLQLVFLGSTGGTLMLMGLLLYQRVLLLEQVLMEIWVLALVLLCFSVMPLLLGFTLYFVILHALKVLKEEYLFLNMERKTGSVGQFIQLVAPFTLFSLAGIGLLFGLIYVEILPISYGYCLLIAISSITLPHVFVMNRFYQFLFEQNFYKRPEQQVRDF